MKFIHGQSIKCDRSLWQRVLTLLDGAPSFPLMLQIKCSFTALGLLSPILSHFGLSCGGARGGKGTFIELAPDCKANCHQAINFFLRSKANGFALMGVQPTDVSLGRVTVCRHTKVNEAYTPANCCN